MSSGRILLPKASDGVSHDGIPLEDGAVLLGRNGIVEKEAGIPCESMKTYPLNRSRNAMISSSFLNTKYARGNAIFGALKKIFTSFCAMKTIFLRYGLKGFVNALRCKINLEEQEGR